MKLTLVETLAFAGIALYIGAGVRRLIPVLSRYNIPAPVIGGLLVATALTAARSAGDTTLTFDTTLQSPLMIAFFASIGFAASLSLLRMGGPHVVIFFVASTLLAIVQNAVGVALSYPLGVHPLFGVLAGSVTLTGGPATGLAFAPLFEQAGVTGASAIAIAAAMLGIISGGLVGGPVGTWLIRRNSLRSSAPPRPAATPDETTAVSSSSGGADAQDLLKHVVIMLAVLWAGEWISRGFTALEVTLPSYIGAMLAAAFLRNLDDRTRWLRLSGQALEEIGAVALSLFITMALMTLDLGKLASVALPILVLVAVQVVLVAAVCVWPMFRLMGRDYDSAVMGAGLCGFMLGTTANAVANMGALVQKYGPAPRAFLIVPMVGAFFIDFTNAIVINTFLNLLK
ncbi:sodium/glutamate symporter [Archangium lansingense]|uniref:Sodium/glutamate symporter n=1 Tax=Archangium lansingense TaxID=2995310 RepID=A0ABT4A2B9_9BACT|nr:sodium/glutamate symporter [Archangium lansinium]MCY1075746.1 sodium/glutamate symporter [Archangium lansinium]